MTKQGGAFGGHYNHKVIKELRFKLAQSNLITQALVEHTGIGEKELQLVVDGFIKKQHAKMAAERV